MNGKLKPAGIAGVACGIAAALPYLDSVCCAVAIGAGVLGTYLYFKDLPAGPNRYGPGATVGLLAGLVAAVAATVVAVIRVAAGWTAADADQGLGQLGQLGEAGVPQEVVDFVATLITIMGEVSVKMIAITLGVYLIGYAIASTIGGLVGAAIFAKKE